MISESNAKKRIWKFLSDLTEHLGEALLHTKLYYLSPLEFHVIPRPWLSFHWEKIQPFSYLHFHLQNLQVTAVVTLKPIHSILPFWVKESILEAQMEHVLIFCTSTLTANTVINQKASLLLEGSILRSERMCPWKKSLWRHLIPRKNTLKHNVDELIEKLEQNVSYSFVNKCFFFVFYTWS